MGGRGWLGRAIVAVARQRQDLRVTVVSRHAVDGVVVADPLDRASLAAATAGCDVVVNAAGCKTGSPDEHATANVQLPEGLAALAAEQGWRLVHLGSAAEYGVPAGTGTAGSGRIPEDHPCRPTSLYGTSKLAGTEAVLAWRDRGAQATVARIFNLVDRDLPFDHPVAGIVRQVRESATASEPQPVAIGDPTTTRDLCPRSWAAQMVLALASAPPEVPAAADATDVGVVNVCSGRAISYGALAYDVASHLGARITVRDLGWPRGGRVVGDPSRLQRLLPLDLTVPMDDPADVLVGPAGTRHDISRHAAGDP